VKDILISFIGSPPMFLLVENSIGWA